MPTVTLESEVNDSWVSNLRLGKAGLWNLLEMTHHPSPVRSQMERREPAKLLEVSDLAVRPPNSNRCSLGIGPVQKTCNKGLWALTHQCCLSAAQVHAGEPLTKAHTETLMCDIQQGHTKLQVS